MAEEGKARLGASQDSPKHSGTMVVAPDRGSAQVADDELVRELDAICAIVHQQLGHDFSRYKPPTLLRRIRRRIQLHRCTSAADYLGVLRASSTEAEELCHDLLIGVTEFFRDPEIFDMLAEDLLPTIINQGNPRPTLRLWVAGCASGEEAYSLAILVSERLARTQASVPVQIFGTDIDTELIGMARQGRYPQKIEEQVSPERLSRYFVREGDFYQVTREIRSMCAFSEHSLIRDPPFSSIDLISCRNLLIYFGADLQGSLVPLFHYALRPGGYLLLGPSESLAAHAELFHTVDKRHRIFRRNDAAVRPTLRFPLARRSVPEHSSSRSTEAEVNRATPTLLSHAFERMIIEDYAPPCAVVNEQGDILYLAGRLGRYLQVAAGRPSHNIGDLAQGAFRLELRNALQRVAVTQQTVTRNRLALQLDGETQLLRLTVRPLPGLQASSGLYVLLLQPMISAESSPVDPTSDGSTEQGIVEQLEAELHVTQSEELSKIEGVDRLRCETAIECRGLVAA